MSAPRELMAHVLYDAHMSISLDHCADVADRLLEALSEAGYTVVPTEPRGGLRWP